NVPSQPVVRAEGPVGGVCKDDSAVAGADLIAEELSVRVQQVAAAISSLGGGATVPFTVSPRSSPDGGDNLPGTAFWVCHLITGPSGHGLALQLRIAPVAMLAPPQARRMRPGGQRPRRRPSTPQQCSLCSRSRVECERERLFFAPSVKPVHGDAILRANRAH